MYVTWSEDQHIGSRGEQQDSLAVKDLGGGRQAAVVADGMGGMEGGSLASRTAVEAFLKGLGEARETAGPEALLAALAEANHAVLEMARDRAFEGRMGTTLTALLVESTRAHFVSVGDSSLYVLRDGQLVPVSRHHTYGEVLDGRADRGEMSLEEALADRDREALVGYLGAEELTVIDTDSWPLEPGDRLLICSDGLDRVLPTRELTQLLAEPSSGARRLVQATLSKRVQGQDNVSAIVGSVAATDSPLVLRSSISWRLALLGATLVVALLVLLSLLGERHRGQTPPLPRPSPGTLDPGSPREDPGTDASRVERERPGPGQLYPPSAPPEESDRQPEKGLEHPSPPGPSPPETDAGRDAMDGNGGELEDPASEESSGVDGSSEPSGGPPTDGEQGEPVADGARLEMGR
jgi:protein phosphatase